MRFCLISLCVILCAVYTHSESRQYYPGVGYVSTGDRPVSNKSARLRAAPAAARNNQQRSRPARLREYELLEREELAPARRQTRRNYRNSNRRSSARRSSPGRRYRLARNEATTVDPPPASEPVASIPIQPAQSAQPTQSVDSSPVRAFGGIFPNFQAGGLGGVTGGGFAQTNGPGAAFAAGFAQSSGSQSFAGGFGAVINHPKFPKFGGSGGRPKDSDLDNVSSKDDPKSYDSGFDDPIDDSER